MIDCKSHGYEMKERQYVQLVAVTINYNGKCNYDTCFS